jgi:hypothetical protein
MTDYIKPNTKSGLPEFPIESNTPRSCKECNFSSEETALGIWCEFYRTHARTWDERYKRCSAPWKELVWIKFKRDDYDQNSQNL